VVPHQDARERTGAGAHTPHAERRSLLNAASVITAIEATITVTSAVKLCRDRPLWDCSGRKAEFRSRSVHEHRHGSIREFRRRSLQSSLHARPNILPHVLLFGTWGARDFRHSGSGHRLRDRPYVPPQFRR